MTKAHALLFYLLLGLSSASPLGLAAAELPDDAPAIIVVQ